MTEIYGIIHKKMIYKIAKNSIKNFIDNKGIKMLINEYIDRLLDVLKIDPITRLPVAIKNDLRIDDDLNKIFNYKNVGIKDAFSFSIKSLHYINQVMNKMQNNELEKDTKFFMKKSHIYELRKLDKIFPVSNFQSDYIPVYEFLRNLFLKTILSLYLLNLDAKKEFLNFFCQKKGQSFNIGDFFAGFDEYLIERGKYLQQNKIITDIIFNLDRMKLFPICLEYLKERQFQSYDECIDCMISMLEFLINPQEERQEEMKDAYAFFVAKGNNLQQINVMIIDILGFILLVQLLNQEELEYLVTRKDNETDNETESENK